MGKITLNKLLVLATTIFMVSCEPETTSIDSEDNSESSSSEIDSSLSEDSSSSSSDSSSSTSGEEPASSDSSSSEWVVNTEFAQQLHNQMIEDHKYYTTYGELRDIFVYSDPDPEKEGYILDFYSKESINGTWDNGTTYNREHVWCKSLSNGLWNDKSNKVSAGTDLLHIRPCATSYNSARGNKPFGVVSNPTKEDATGKYDSKTFEPADVSKGDVARELMYVYVHYGTQYGGTTNQYTGALNITDIVYTPEGTDEAAFKLLLEWNEIDPVDSIDITLNDYAQTVQGNRNPFIDHPEYATTIWGQTSDEQTSAE